MKHIIINADDFGLSTVFNSHILKLLQEGLIHSTTAMVFKINKDYQKDQIDHLLEINEGGSISVGLHLDFQDGEISLTTEAIDKQYNLFIDIFGIQPSHLDVHKFMQYSESDLDILLIEYAKEKKLPLRNRGRVNAENSRTTEQPAFHATRKSFEEIQDFIDSLGDTERGEILIHPGEFDPDCTSSLNHEREGDTLLAKQIAGYAKEQGISLSSYLDMKKHLENS